MLGNLFAPEHLLIVLVGVLVWLAPLAAFLWALVTLARLRRGQEAILARLGTLEASLARTGRSGD